MIIWFSGNGNSRLVARRLADQLGDRELSLMDCGDSLPESEQRVVWVFPVYSWGIPPVVLAFMRRVGLPRNASHYLILTCGDDIGLTDRQWSAELIRREARPAGAFSVIMPNTYVLLPGMDTDSKETETRKLHEAVGRIDGIARLIAEDSQGIVDVTRGALPGFKSKVLYPLFVRFMMSPRPFHATDACVGCGACVRTCPKRNITLVENRPKWGGDCTLCLGCYHVCPVHAVAYGRRTDRKNQYHSPDSLQG